MCSIYTLLARNPFHVIGPCQVFGHSSIAIEQGIRCHSKCETERLDASYQCIGQDRTTFSVELGEELVELAKSEGVELSDDQLASVAGGLGDIEDEVPPCLCGGRFRVDFMSGPWYYFSCEKCGAQLIGG